MLTTENIANIDNKLKLVGLIVLQKIEKEQLNYINTVVVSVCDEWQVVYNVAKSRTTAGSCGNFGVLKKIKELAKYDGCNLDEGEKKEVPSSYFIGFNFEF